MPRTSRLDARLHYNPRLVYVLDLIDKAQAVAGSRNLLAFQTGISRRRLGYIEAGFRTLPSGRVIPVAITFAEQVTLEHVIKDER